MYDKETVEYHAKEIIATSQNFGVIEKLGFIVAGSASGNTGRINGWIALHTKNFPP